MVPTGRSSALFWLAAGCVASWLQHATGIYRRRVFQEENPLLTRLDEEFPPWDAIQAKHVVPAVMHWIQEAKAEFKALEEAVAKPGFQPSADALLRPYNLLGENLGRAYGWVTHLKS